MEQYNIGDLQYTKQINPNSIVYALEGEIDLNCSEALAKSLKNSIHAENVSEVTADLSGVSFIDCRGIYTLIAAHNEATYIDRIFKIRQPSKIAQKVLRLTQVEHFLNIESKPID